MDVLSKDEVKVRKHELVRKIRDGAIFIHPTDTIYGLGCNAKNDDAVKKIREIKGRPNTPFSVMVHSKDWIYENCEVNESAKEWIEKLPGPYTFILKLKNKGVISSQINPGLDTVGIRMPDHWIIKGAELLNLPVVTTSANKVGEYFMTTIDNLSTEIKGKVDFIIYEGEKKGRPSEIVDLSGKEAKIIKR